MSNGMTIKVRIHPMYSDFIRHLMGSDDKGRVFASEDHTLGLLIKNLLRTQPEKSAKINFHPGQFIEFVLPTYEEINTLYRNYISETAEKIIASKIRKRFYYEMHDYIIDMHSNGITEKRKAIILFCEQFEISEDNYKANSLEREYKRAREKEKFMKKRVKIASSLAAFLSIVCPHLVLFA